MRGIPVLMYHALEDEAHPAGAKDAGEQLYVLPVHQFRKQMECLQREGYRTFLLDELLAPSELPEKAVVLTFDDGHESDFTLALPILLEYGFKAEFYITTGWIGTPYFLNEEQIQGLHKAGMGIGSHGVTHSFFDDLDVKGVERELFESRDRLSKIIGESVNSFSAPGGRLHKTVENRAISRGYKTICTSVPGYIVNGCSFYKVPRVPICANTKFETFVSLVSADKGMIVRMQRRNALLGFSKRVLGNKLYQKIRSILLD